MKAIIAETRRMQKLDQTVLDGLASAEPWGLVLYTDGGSDLKAGLGGWGIHGYRYPIIEPKKDVFTKSTHVPSTLGYVDGRLAHFAPVKSESRVFPDTIKLKGKYSLYEHPNPKEAAPVVPDYTLSIHGAIDRGTVNQCEYTSMLVALQIINRTQPAQAVILADSELTLAVVRAWAKKWAENGWRTQNGEVKNLELAQALLAELRILDSSGIRVEYAHVFSHSGFYGNDMADTMATRGKILCRQLRKRNAPMDEWRTPVMSLVSNKEAKAEAKAAAPSRYLEQRFWYGLCNRKSTDWGPNLADKHVYLLGDHGKATEPEMIGVEVASSTIGVWISDKPEPVLDGLQRLLHQEYYEGVSTVTLGNLANITQKARYARLSTNVLEELVYPEDEPILKADDGAVLLEQLRPTWNGYVLIEELENLVCLAEEFLHSPGTLCVTDVTDQIYEVVERGKKAEWKTRAEVNPPNRTIKLRVRVSRTGEEYDDIICKLDTDLASRNTLAAVAGESTRVHIITLRTGTASFLYYGVLQSEEGLLLTAGLTSNHVIRKESSTK